MGDGGHGLLPLPTLLLFVSTAEWRIHPALGGVLRVDAHVVVAEVAGEDLRGAAAEPEVDLDPQLGGRGRAPCARAGGRARGGAVAEYDHAAEPHGRARE